jgi:hypothetical protein
VSTIVGASWDEKSTLANLIIGGLEHYKETQLAWEHEFLIATVCRPDDSEHYETGRRFKIPTAMVNCADHQRN